MDISTIADITELKALAYDEIVRIEQAQQNLAVINGRINDLNNKGETGMLRE